MGGRGANSSSTNSIRRFSKMDPEEAFSEYYKSKCKRDIEKHF